MYVKYKKYLTYALVASLYFSLTYVVYAADATESSIQADFVNKVFEVSLTDGSNAFTTKEDAKEREELNDAIYSGQDVGTRSLYDRFGGDIRFVPYLGEKKFKLSLIDTFYDNAKKDNELFSFSLSDFWADRSAQVNNVVYPGRPDVVSETNYKEGWVDPRRAAYAPVSSVSGQASVANFYLSLAKNFTFLVAYLSGSGLYESLKQIWQSLTSSGFYEGVSDVFLSLMPLLLAAFVVRFAYYTIKALKGEKSFSQLGAEALTVALSLGFIYLFAEEPDALSELGDFVVTAVDDVFTEVINEASDEVAKSDDHRYVVEANLWKKTVLDPWAKGMFDGRKYDELYTQFETDPSKTKMPQSNDAVTESWPEGEVRYNSAALTGDVKVPTSVDSFVRNWAALAWSTQSIYHIDAVDRATDASGKAWPRASTTPNNPQIYVDSFRWLDAKLDVSPEYYASDDVVKNYTGSREYKVSFVSAGFESLFMSLLLIPMLYVIMRRLWIMIQIIMIGVRLMMYSMIHIVYPVQFSPLHNLKRIGKSMYNYLWWSAILYIMIILFKELAGNSFIHNIIYLVLCILIIRYNPIRNENVMELVQWGKMQFNNIKGILKKSKK